MLIEHTHKLKAILLFKYITEILVSISYFVLYVYRDKRNKLRKVGMRKILMYM